MRPFHRGHFILTNLSVLCAKDESLLRLLDNPKTLPIIEAVMGGNVQVSQTVLPSIP